MTSTQQQNYKKQQHDDEIVISAKSVSSPQSDIVQKFNLKLAIPSPQEIDDENKDIWYKRMHATIHKAKDDGNYELSQ